MFSPTKWILFFKTTLNKFFRKSPQDNFYMNTSIPGIPIKEYVSG